jgi:hypothetical protein
MATIPGRLNKPTLASVTIANGASLSNATDLKGLTLYGIIMPATWTTAGITFQVSYDGGTTFQNLQSKTAEYSVTAAAAQTILIPRTELPAITQIKVRSGTAGSPVTQAADRIVTLIAGDV